MTKRLQTLIDQAVRRAVREEFRAAQGLSSSEDFRALKPPAATGVYYILVGARVKIGKAKNIAARVRDLGCVTPEPPQLIAFELGNHHELEHKAHRRWAQYRRHREWFSFEGDLAAWLVEKNVEQVPARATP